MENEKRNLEHQLSSARSSCAIRSKSYERGGGGYQEKSSSYNMEQLEQENRELRAKVRRLECQLLDKEAEVVRLKSQMAAAHASSHAYADRSTEVERHRAAQLQAEKLLEAREHSHRQQVLRLETQVRG